MSAEIPVSRTKIIIPGLRREVVHRPRLLSLLDDALDRKLILVYAPAGYGKTTLLADYARRGLMPACWLSLDPLDKDPQRFAAGLIASIAERFAGFGQDARAALHTLTSFEQEIEHLLTVLVNEIAEKIDIHFVLIVDDYQFIDHVPVIRAFFSRFLALSGENCHVLLASRRLPDLPDIAQMVARQQVSGFDLHELAFQPGEIRSLYENTCNRTIDETTLNNLVFATEGWVTGLYLSAFADPATGPTKIGISRTPGMDLEAYLDRQLFAPLPAETRDFLLKTSLFDEFDASLCAAVFGPGAWQEQIRTIQKDNLFVLPVGPEGQLTRYHPLFQDFLQQRLHAEQPQETITILERLAEVHQEHQEWEKAWDILQKRGDPRQQARLIERAGTFLLLGGRLITLQLWLENIPSELLEQSPCLLSLQGALLCATGQATAAAPLLDQAVDRFRSANDLPGLTQALVRRAAARRLLGRNAETVADADQAIQLAGTQPGLEAEHADALRYRGLGLARLGKPEPAAAALEESLREYESLGETESVARLQMELGQICRALGQWSTAARYYGSALETWQQAGNHYSQVTALNSLGVLHHAEGNYEQAVKAFEEGLTRSRQGGFAWQKALLLASLGDLLADIDEYESARRAYDTALTLALQINYPFIIRHLALAQARLARVTGKYHETRIYIQTLRDLPADPNPVEEGLLQLEDGILSLHEGDPATAITKLEQALLIFREGQQSTETAWTYAWLGAARAASGDGITGGAYLREALASLPAEAGEMSLLPVLRRVLPWFTTSDTDPETAARLGRVSQAGNALPALRRKLRRILTVLPLQPARLEIQAMGKPQVRVGGKLLTLTQWQSLAVRDLFFYLVSRSRPITKEEIGEVFWPGLALDQLRLRFKNNLYRLRRAVGQDVVLFENDSYFFNRQIDYEYDVEVFQTRLAQASAAQSSEERLTRLEEAAALWRGPFLLDVDGTWVLPEREQLERAYLDALRNMTALQRKAGQPKAALQTCRRALQTNNCLEDFHREAMRLHADLDDRLAVIWQYKECCAALQTELGLDPSEETRALYERLIA